MKTFLITVYLVVGCISCLYIILGYKYNNNERKWLAVLMPAFWLPILVMAWIYEISFSIIKMLHR